MTQYINNGFIKGMIQNVMLGNQSGGVGVKVANYLQGKGAIVLYRDLWI